MSNLFEELSKLASELDELGHLEIADQVDDISAIMTDVDVASGQHVPAGDVQWSLPTVGAKLNKGAMGLNDIHIGDAPYEHTVDEDDQVDTQLFSGDDPGFAMPPINRKYNEADDLGNQLEELEAGLRKFKLSKYANRVNKLKTKVALVGPVSVGLMGAGAIGGATALGYYAFAEENPNDPRVQQLKKYAREFKTLGITKEDLDRLVSRTDSPQSIVQEVPNIPEDKKSDITFKLGKYLQIATRLSEIQNANPDDDRKAQLLTRLVGYWGVRPEWLTSYTASSNNGQSPKNLQEIWNFVVETKGHNISLFPRFMDLMDEWYRNYSGNGGIPVGVGSNLSPDPGSDTEPRASGPVGRGSSAGSRRQVLSDSVKALQTALGISPTGAWEPDTNPAWAKFVEDEAKPYLEANPIEGLDPANLIADWRIPAPKLGLEPTVPGMTAFVNKVKAAGESTEEGVSETPETPTSPEEAAGEINPATADEVRKVLLMLQNAKVPHLAEDPYGVAQTLGGGTSRRRSRRYVRQLSKLYPEDGNDTSKVASHMVDKYQDSIQAELQKAKTMHEEHPSAGAYTETERTAHLSAIVYTLLQREWGDMSGAGKDRRSERRERREDARGRRRLNRER